MNRKTVLCGFALLLFAAVLSMTTTGARAAEDIEQMVATAKTAADHEAIAAYYDKEVADAKQKAESHRKLIEQYKSHFRMHVPSITNHCKLIVEGFDRIAKEDASLVAEHRKMAKEAK